MTKVRNLFDPQVIRMLACTMGNKPLAFRFLGDYFDLLPGTEHRTINAIQDEDPEAAMDAHHQPENRLGHGRRQRR